MLHDVLVQPLINLLAAIYALVPGHDFGLAIIVFTVLVRLALWPLVRKQIRQQKALRELQPEIARIRASAKGDKQKEAQLVMELYREREINPFASIGVILIQFPILIALFVALRTILQDGRIVDEAYAFVRELGYMRQIAADPALFQPHFLGINLGATGYIPLAAASALAQYAQTKQLMPQPKERRKLTDILKKTAQTGDNSEAIAAMNRGMGPLFSGLMFVAAISLPAALALYWTTGSLVGILQQRMVLRRDVAEAESKVKVEVIDPSAKTSPARRAKKTSPRKRSGKQK
jgi:YidC/Oxa1 family membrane protein insertase